LIISIFVASVTSTLSSTLCFHLGSHQRQQQILIYQSNEIHDLTAQQKKKAVSQTKNRIDQEIYNKVSFFELFFCATCELLLQSTEKKKSSSITHARDKPVKRANATSVIQALLYFHQLNQTTMEKVFPLWETQTTTTTTKRPKTKEKKNHKMRKFPSHSEQVCAA
jgi:formate dehydrogenase maturation protein FdhE